MKSFSFKPFNDLGQGFSRIFGEFKRRASQRSFLGPRVNSGIGKHSAQLAVYLENESREIPLELFPAGKIVWADLWQDRRTAWLNVLPVFRHSAAKKNAVKSILDGYVGSVRFVHKAFCQIPGTLGNRPLVPIWGGA